MAPPIPLNDDNASTGSQPNGTLASGHPVKDTHVQAPNGKHTASPNKVAAPVNSAEEVFGRDMNTPYTMLNQPLGKCRAIKIIYLGGGASAINMAYKIKKYLSDVDFTAYEKNSRLAGTWFENKYPGCACDIPSHTYQFTWALNPDWSNYYSGTDEIEAYFNKVADDFDLRKYFHVGHEVVGARWDAETSHWFVRIRPVERPDEEFEDWCDVFLNGSGLLNAWKWPTIPGLHDFKGKLLHTAHWENVDLENKRVALIGVGSSAVQVLPAIQPNVKHVHHFIRSKTWISPSFASKYAGKDGNNFSYTEEQKERFQKDPKAQREYAKAIEMELNKRWKFIIKDSPAQKEIFDALKQDMTKKLCGRQDLIDTLVPDFAVGCRRLTPAPGFLESLQKENVTATTDRIAKITETGIETTNGDHIEFDVIICATGFDISFKPRFPLIGQNGIDLRDQWTPRSQAYLSMFVPNFPNYFVIMGPGSPAAHGSLLPSTEHVSDYLVKVLHRMQTEPIKSISVKPSVVKEYFEHAQEQVKITAWSSSCSSWFKNGDPNGPLDSLHPGGRLHFFSMLQNPRWEDFDYEYANNRFAFMGNGFTQREIEERDLVWYWNTGDRLSLFQY